MECKNCRYCEDFRIICNCSYVILICGECGFIFKVSIDKIEEIEILRDMEGDEDCKNNDCKQK